MMSSRLVAMGLMLGLLGCADEADVNEASQERAVLEAAEALGLDPALVQVGEQQVTYDGDLVFDREKLLNGDYEGERPAGSSEEQKGYRYPTLITDNMTNIKLAWSSTYPPSTTIKNAFINAAGDYNGTSTSSLVISQSNTGASITVWEIPDASWTFLSPCQASEPACVTPSAGHVGPHLYIRSNPQPGVCGWTTSTLAFVARHELGHAVGFTHIKQAGSTFITGTTPCGGTEAACADGAPYTSVMKKTLVVNAAPACTAATGIPLLLQTDDKASLAALYP